MELNLPRQQPTLIICMPWGTSQTLAYFNQPLYATFEGQNSVVTDVLVKYTWYGDANVDGKVDGSDYSRIDFAYTSDLAQPGLYTGWSNGDFNYDGGINGSD